MFDCLSGETVQIVSDYVMPPSRTADIIITSLFVAYMFTFLAMYANQAYRYCYRTNLFKDLKASLILYFAHILLALATPYALSLDSASFNSANSTSKLIFLVTLGFEILMELAFLIHDHVFKRFYISKRGFLFAICLTVVAKLCTFGILLFNIFWSFGVLLLIVLYCAYYAWYSWFGKDFNQHFKPVYHDHLI